MMFAAGFGLASLMGVAGIARFIYTWPTGGAE